MLELLVALRFLTGCWTLESKGASIDESWSRAAGGMMAGYSRKVRGDRLIALEFLKIEPRDGRLAYVPLIRGKETVFRAVKIAEGEAIFENPEHDFPQRIIYRKNDTGLLARIESLDGKKGTEYPYKRAACSD
jgi:hypothetical protein